MILSALVHQPARRSFRALAGEPKLQRNAGWFTNPLAALSELWQASRSFSVMQVGSPTRSPLFQSFGGRAEASA